MTELSKREVTRAKLVESTGRGFRRYGYNGIGIDGLSSLAEVTSGAFYAHMGSKSKAFVVALEQGLDEVIGAIPAFQSEHKSHWTLEFAKFYMRSEHACRLEHGCALSTLIMDVSREKQFQSGSYQKKLDTIISLISGGLTGSDTKDRQQRAWGYISILVGGINFVRTIEDKQLQGDLSTMIVNSAVKVAGRAKAPRPSNTKS